MATEAAGGYPRVHPDQPVELAMERMAQAGWTSVPVVDRADVSRLRGLITVEGVLRAYRRKEAE